MPDCEYIHKEMAKSSANLTLLWDEYYQEARIYSGFQDSLVFGMVTQLNPEYSKNTKTRWNQRVSIVSNIVFLLGGDKGIRTPGLLNAIQARSQLRHIPL